MKNKKEKTILYYIGFTISTTAVLIYFIALGMWGFAKCFVPSPWLACITLFVFYVVTKIKALKPFFGAIKKNGTKIIFICIGINMVFFGGQILYYYRDNQSINKQIIALVREREEIVKLNSETQLSLEKVGAFRNFNMDKLDELGDYLENTKLYDKKIMAYNSKTEGINYLIKRTTMWYVLPSQVWILWPGAVHRKYVTKIGAFSEYKPLSLSIYDERYSYLNSVEYRSY